MPTIKEILMLLAIMALYGLAGHMDYQDAMRRQEFIRARHEVCARSSAAPHANTGSDGDSPAPATAMDECAVPAL
jgi:hypothetical protein